MSWSHCITFISTWKNIINFTSTFSMGMVGEPIPIQGTSSPVTGSSFGSSSLQLFFSSFRAPCQRLEALVGSWFAWWKQLLIERMVISGEGAALMETLVKADTTYGFLLQLLTMMLFRGILSLQFCFFWLLRFHSHLGDVLTIHPVSKESSQSDGIPMLSLI